MYAILQFQCTEAIRIPPEKGEEIREKAINERFLDTKRKIRKLRTDEGNFLEIPVTEAAGEKVENFQVTEQKNPEFLEKTWSLKEYLKDFLSEVELASVPAGWQILGDIIIIGIPEILEDKKTRIAEALLSDVPQVQDRCKGFWNRRAVPPAKKRTPSRQRNRNHPQRAWLLF